MNVTVWRVQMPNGTGPYANRRLWDPDGNFWYDFAGENHPPPDEEGIEVKWNFNCGFATREKALEWFFNPEHRKALNDNGFLLYKFTVDESLVRYGNKGRQLMFKKSEATHDGINYWEAV